MNKKGLILMLLMAVGATSAYAVPAYPAKRMVITADGKQVTLTLKGDEHFSFYTDEQNRAYVRQASGQLQEVSLDEASALWKTRIQADAAARPTTARRVSAISRVGEPKPSLTGKKKGLVILMEFDDVKFSHDAPQAIYKDFFNKENYSDYGMSGSVHDYFMAQSYNKLDIDFDVVGPYTTYYAMSYYGAPSGNSNDSRPNEMVWEACRAADADVNFADYDWDGDGEVDQVFVIYAGYGQNYGADENTIWPHEWSMSAANRKMILDNTKIDTYACSCELRGTSGTALDGIGAACHEFSHCLGLPDFYDTSGNNYAMGYWDVMCDGSYNNGSRTPAGYTSYERMFAGWLEPVELNSMTRISDMKPLAETPEAYILYNEGHRDEYYLLENRQLVGFDRALSGHGLLVVHVDYDKGAWSANNVNVTESRQHMTIIPADNRLGYNNEAGDPFPGSGGVTSLTNYTTPAAALYVNNTDGTKLMGKPIDNIREEGQLISFVACRPDMEIPQFKDDVQTEGRNFTVSWNAVADAVSYELELTELPADNHDLESSRLLEENFSKCYSKTTGFTDISSNIVNYVGTAGWTGSKLYTSANNLLIGTSSASGYVVSPTYDVPASSNITVVVGGKPFKEGTPVKGTIHFITNSGTENVPFELTAEGRLVFHLSTRDTRFRIGVYPESRMFMNYLAIYEGTFTEEELGITSATRQNRVSTATFTTSDTSYTFANMEPTSIYYYRIRAIGSEVSSLWSDERQFVFPTTGIVIPTMNSATESRLFDLQGRRVDAPRKGIYIRDGRKVVY